MSNILNLPNKLHQQHQLTQARNTPLTRHARVTRRACVTHKGNTHHLHVTQPVVSDILGVNLECAKVVDDDDLLVRCCAGK
jgi:hypothetical protein